MSSVVLYNKNVLLKYVNETDIDEKVLKALEKIDRKEFVRPEYIDYAYEDTPLPIGYGQTISQPSTVAFMLTLLDVRKGFNVLDVGTGSGWTTALLSILVGKDGKVTGTEIIKELYEFGEENISKFKNCSNVQLFLTKSSLGYEPNAPYDRILVSAASVNVPETLIKQLKNGGIMVIPIQNSVFKIIKKFDDGKITTEEYPGFNFVPLIQGVD